MWSDPVSKAGTESMFFFNSIISVNVYVHFSAGFLPFFLFFVIVPMGDSNTHQDKVVMFLLPNALSVMI